MKAGLPVLGSALGLACTLHAGERLDVPAATFPMGCSVEDPACDKDEGPAGGTPV